MLWSFLVYIELVRVEVLTYQIIILYGVRVTTVTFFNTFCHFHTESSPELIISKCFEIFSKIDCDVCKLAEKTL